MKNKEKMTTPDKMTISKPKPKVEPERIIHILVVDDLKVNFLLVKAMLGKLNAQIYYTESGFKAIEHIRSSNNIDVVLMDFNMPGMDGKETTELIKSMKPHLPVISLSTFTDKAVFDQSSAPYDAYITKPVNPELLIELIFKVIQKNF